jgi:drug/metabolite transporter (DMT)-like permease
LDRRYLLVVAAGALWALIGVWANELDELGVSATQIGAWRAVIGGACFVAHAAATGSLAEARRFPVRPTLLLAALGVTLFYVALPAAVAEGGVSLAWVLLYTAPAMVAVGARVWLHERLSRVGAALVGLTLLGVVLVVAPESEGVNVSARSVGWGLAAAFGYASIYVAGKPLTERFAPATVFAVTLPLGALPLVPVLGLPDGGRTWALLVGLGVVSTYLPYLAYGTALRHVPANRAAVVAAVEPVLAVLVGVVVYDESLHPVAVLGAAVVVGAVVAAAMVRGDDIDDGGVSRLGRSRDRSDRGAPPADRGR